MEENFSLSLTTRHLIHTQLQHTATKYKKACMDKVLQTQWSERVTERVMGNKIFKHIFY